ncbi:MAG: Fe-S cluster assembly protein SufD [Bdellovibrionaceae bacterium]|nr:Fe-S cluster assembly protein SufD [Pseudobdellovibrionaceae bacterium]
MMDLLSASQQLKPLAPELQNWRNRGAEFVRARGLPTRKDPNWKYTSVRLLEETAFSLPPESRPSHDTMKAIAQDLNGEFWNIVFVNGVLDHTLSCLEDLPGTVKWSVDPTAADGEFIDAFEALNVAYLTQTLSLKIQAGSSQEKPLRVHYVTNGAATESLMVHPRVSIEVGSRASAVVVESYASFGAGKSFTNAQTSIRLDPSAKLVHARLEEESPRALHIGRTVVAPAKDSDFTSLVYSTGARLSRHHLQITLKEKNVTTRSFGLYAGDAQQHIDNTTDIDHQVGECTTTQIYKGLLDGEARAVFNGRIYIRPNAQKVNSEQLNNNLLLSSKAEADSQPQLMIEADDVKAAHGSTVGHLSAEEIFYLQSRGLSRRQAVPLLAYAFLADVIERLDHEFLRRWLEARLRRNFERFKTEGL